MSLRDEIKKNTDIKKREKYKFLAAILVSNMFVFVLFSGAFTSNEVESEQVVQKIFHKEYVLVNLPIREILVSNSEKSPETPVTLLNKNKKIIIQKAYLHNKQTGIRIESSEFSLPFFNIEISRKDLKKISEFAQDGVIVMPYIETSDIKGKMDTKKGLQYEVSLF